MWARRTAASRRVQSPALATRAPLAPDASRRYGSLRAESTIRGEQVLSPCARISEEASCHGDTLPFHDLQAKASPLRMSEPSRCELADALALALDVGGSFQFTARGVTVGDEAHDSSCERRYDCDSEARADAQQTRVHFF